MIQPAVYLSFPGTCEEAFRFYEKTLGGKILATMKGKDAPPEAGCTGDFREKIMHTRMQVNGTLIMGSDAPGGRYDAPKGFSINLSVNSPEEAERLYATLAEGGAQLMPLGETFWAHRFGMCVDRFGTPWMVNCEKSGN